MMKIKSTLTATSITVGSLMLAASPAMASTAPIPVPEPGTLSIYLAGIAGLAIACRFIGRK